MKKTIKRAIKLCIFLSLANLPFITATQLIGIGTFLDSFENPEMYYYIQGNGYSMEPTITDGNYILLQKSSHPSFSVEQGDVVLYFKDNGARICHRIHHISAIGPFKRYHTMGDNNNLCDKPIYEYQIIGKVVGIIDNNIWNKISMDIWDIAIHEFNVNALFND